MYYVTLSQSSLYYEGIELNPQACTVQFLYFSIPKLG